MKRRGVVVAAGAAVAAVLAGCAGTTPPVDWFSLVPDGAVPPAPAEPQAGVLVGLVTVPEEVDRPQLVLRGTAPSQPVLLEAQRWSEPLKAQLPRALALGIAAQWPQAVVAAAPGGALPRPDWRLAIDVQRFELRGGAARRAVLHAVWSAGTLPARREAVEVEAASGEPAALVAAMAQAVQQLAGRIAAALQAARIAPLSPR